MGGEENHYRSYRSEWGLSKAPNMIAIPQEEDLRRHPRQTHLWGTCQLILLTHLLKIQRRTSCRSAHHRFSRIFLFSNRSVLWCGGYPSLSKFVSRLLITASNLTKKVPMPSYFPTFFEHPYLETGLIYALVYIYYIH